MSNPLKRMNALTALTAVASMAIIDQTGIGIDGEVVTIDGVIFELDADDTITAGNVQVDISASSTAIADVAAALALAINANATLQAKNFVATVETNNSIVQVVVEAPAPFTATTDYTNATVLVITGAPSDGVNELNTVLVERVPTAAEVTSGTMIFAFAGTPQAVAARARVTATGVPKYLTDAVSIAGRRVVIETQGATTFAATDTVGVIVALSKSVD